MNSEKVKEIKKALEYCSNHSISDCSNVCPYDKYTRCRTELTKDSLTLINELESENERLNKSDTSKEESSIEYYNLYRDFKRENQQLKNRIAELEKENETKTDTIANLLKNQEFYETEKLKQFAEKVKEKLFSIFGKTICSDLDTEDITNIIDEKLEEYSNDER